MPQGSPRRVHFGGAGRECNIRRARQPCLRLQRVHLRCASTRAHHDAFRLFTIACHSQSSGCTAGPPTQVSCASSTGGLPKVSSWRYPSALNLIISAATSADDVLSIQMRCTNDSPFRNIAQVSNQQEGGAHVLIFHRDICVHVVQWVHLVPAQLHPVVLLGIPGC